MKIQNYVKIISASLAISALPLTKAPLYAQTQASGDTFEYSVPAKGTDSKEILEKAPSPEININGEKKKAAIIVDLATNTLYKYNEDGKAEKAYLVASGKPRTPTDKGVRIVTHTESFPYRTASWKTKRRRNPQDYGPRVICLNKIDPESGRQSPTGEFIHGTNRPEKIGEYVSLGCIRMDNEVIKELADEIERGDIVIIK